MPQSRHRREQGVFLRRPLRDRTHSGATVPSPHGKQHSGAGLPIGWRRSRGILAQVRKNGGVLRRETASSASQWRRTQREKQTCSAWPEDLRHQQKGPAPPGEGTCAERKGDRRRREKGPAPPEGRPAPRNCFQCFPVAQDSKRKTDLLRLAGGPAPPEGRPAPPGEGTCAERKGDLRHREKEDRRHPQKGPAP